MLLPPPSQGQRMSCSNRMTCAVREKIALCIRNPLFVIWKKKEFMFKVKEAFIHQNSLTIKKKFWPSLRKPSYVKTHFSIPSAPTGRLPQSKWFLLVVPMKKCFLNLNCSLYHIILFLPQRYPATERISCLYCIKSSGSFAKAIIGCLNAPEFFELKFAL